MNIIPNFSPNFSIKQRKTKDIKFIIFHYTGMQSEIESIKRLKDPRAKVSCHYFISRKGEITQMVEEKKIAWHAGRSRWKKFNNLNNKSIGIELVNKGHRFGYQKFTKKQIKSLIFLCKKLKKRYKIKSENFLGHSDIAPLRKTDPGEKFPWKVLSKKGLGKWYRSRSLKFKIGKKNLRKAFFNNLKKIGYGYFSINKKNVGDTKIIKSFQQRYLPKRITGKINQKTYEISHFLVH